MTKSKLQTATAKIQRKYLAL